MRVKCIYNEGIYLPKEIFVEGSNYTESSTFSLKINKEYIVYAMAIRNGFAWYYICNDQFIYYPIWKPCPLFEIVDNRLSRYWVFTYKRAPSYIVPQAIWAYPEWAEDEYYYDGLIEGDEKEVKLFKAYREKMDLEFLDSSISISAQIGNEEWLICPLCIDGWQCDDEKDALVRCPKCKSLLNNPRYINEWPHL